NTIPGRVSFQTGSDDQQLTLPVVDDVLSSADSNSGQDSNTGQGQDGHASQGGGGGSDSASSDTNAGDDVETDGGHQASDSARDGKSPGPETAGLPAAGGPSAMKLL